MRIDWKFYVTLAVATIGIITPIWLWKFDLDSRSLKLRVISQASLVSGLPESVDGLQISIDGTTLDQPSISVVEVLNDGSKPVPASDYEGPIELTLGSRSKLVRVQVTETLPPDIKPKFTTDESRMLISPMLLNPGDTIRFSILSAQAQPDFAIRARIAGVNEVNIENKANPSKFSMRTGLSIFTAVALFYVYIFSAILMLRGRRFHISRFTAAVTMLSSAFGSAFIVRQLKDTYALTNQDLAIALVPVLLVSSVVAFNINKRGASDF